ncbi:MAG: N-acetylneuraminate synthase family protein [Exilibacterium sp.]
MSEGKIYPERIPLVIAECGINHGGSLQTAMEMVDACAAPVIKFQTHIPEEEMSEEAKYIKPDNADVSIYELMEQCALSEEEERVLKAYVESKGKVFLSTPFCNAAVDRLERLGVEAYKIGSGECNNIPLLEYIADTGRPVILSTGMNDMESIERAVKIFEGRHILALLHCTNVYPTPHELVRLDGITQLQNRFPDAIIGFSDHTQDNYSAFAAVGMGACIIEKHFTDSKARSGPDICCSADPAQLADVLVGVDAISKAWGGEKGILREEKSVSKFAFASLVAKKDMEPGEIFTSLSLTTKRPGTGLPASMYGEILGKACSRRLRAGDQLNESDIA